MTLFSEHKRSRFRSLRDIADFLVGLEAAGIGSNLDSSHNAFRACLQRDRQTFASTYWAVLGRRPEKAVAGHVYRDVSEAADHLIEALKCEELAENFFHIFVKNFPEARRIVFIHIPKTAGSEINNRLNMIDGQFLTHPPADPVERANWFLGFLIEQAKTPHRPIIVAGHYELSRLNRLGLIRKHDVCLTVLRDPREIVISYLNYILMVAIRNPDREDGVQFCALICDSGAEPPLRNADVTPELIQTVLYSDGFAEHVTNILTRYLLTAPSLAQRIYFWWRYVCDVVPMEHIDAYMFERFGVSVDGKANSSCRFLSEFSEQPAKWREYITERLVRADIEFYNDLIKGRAGKLFRIYDAGNTSTGM